MTALSMADQVARCATGSRHSATQSTVAGGSTWSGSGQTVSSGYTIQLQYVSRYWLGEVEIINGYRPGGKLLEPPLKLEHPRTG